MKKQTLYDLSNFEEFFEKFLRNSNIPIVIRNKLNEKKFTFTIIPIKLENDCFMYKIVDIDNKIVFDNIFLFDVAEKIANLLSKGYKKHHKKIQNLIQLDKLFENKRNKAIFIKNFIKRIDDDFRKEVQLIKLENIQFELKLLLHQIKNDQYYI